MHRSLLPLGLAAMAPCGAVASGACTVTTAARLPLASAAGHITTRAQIDGTDITLLVDTGAAVTALDGAAADRLGLDRDPREKSYVVGIGGTARPAAMPLVHALALGELRFTDLRLTVGDFNAGRPVAAHIDGILGSDLLAPYDVEIDRARGQLVLHTVTGCTGRFLDWTAEYQALPLLPFGKTGLSQIRVSVDGHPMTALLDTGASESVLFGPAVRRLGAAALPAAGDRRGFGLGAVAGTRVPTVMHRFETLEVGRDIVRDPSLALVRIAPLSLDMVLGLDYLGERRLWLSHATRQAFITVP